MRAGTGSVQVAILPEETSYRGQLAALLAADGLVECAASRPELWHLAVVDLTAPGASEWLVTAMARGVPALALVLGGDPHGHATIEQLGAVDFVDCLALERELIPRVRRALSSARAKDGDALSSDPRSANGFLEGIINASRDAIIAADLRGTVILFNKGAEELCGYSAEEVIGTHNVQELYPPGVARQIMAQLRDPQVRAQGRLGASRQELVKKNGERIPVSMSASMIYDGSKELATVGIFTDLRDRMQLERKLSDFENRLEQSEKTSVIVELAGTAAHELNQPLTSVMGYADLLKRKLKQDDFAYRPIDIIYREAERMAEIVRKIGKITR